MPGLGEAGLSAMLHRAPALIGLFCLCIGTAPGGDQDHVSLAIRGRAAAPKVNFRAESELVLVPVSVTDSRNHAVIGLRRSAFRVLEDQAEQRIAEFWREDAPLTVGIVFDLSGSMAGKLGKSREAMAQFLHFANPEDEFFLVEFRDRARLAVPFTSDTAAIQNYLVNAQPRGRTALLDAVRLAIHCMRNARYSRRALLVLSDGGDNDSRYSETELLDRLREADVWIYAMGIYVPAPEGQPEIAGGQKLLQMLTEESGGREFAVTSLIDLPVVAARIGVELRNQYVLGYRPANRQRDGKYRRVQVRVGDPRASHVVFRPGYYAVGE